jgi:Golgi phosphoprotein 3 (GPP34)
VTKHLALSDRAFLIAWNSGKGRMTGGSEHKHLVSAAVLAELWLTGLIRDEKGKAVATPSSKADLSPVQNAMLARIRASKPRAWKYWVKKDAKNTRSAIQDSLERSAAIAVQRRSLLGVSRPKITVRDPRVVHDLVGHCRRAALGSEPVKQVDPLDAALTAMVSATELNTVFTGRERRTNRVRIADLAARSGPVPKALRGVVTDNQSAAVAATG